MHIDEITEKISKITNPDEKKVAQLFHNLGFRFIDSNILIGNPANPLGEVDSLFTFGNWVFLIEVSADSNSGSSKIITWLQKWTVRENLEQLLKKYKLDSHKPIRVYFDLHTKTPQNFSPEIKRLTRDESFNKVAYLNDFEYFENCFKKIGVWAKNDLLDWLEYSDEKITKDVDAIQYYIDDVPIFCFVEKVENLLRSCYVSRRRTQDEGYQRTLKEDRVTKISDTIKSGNSLSFPNSILISTPSMFDPVLPKSECPKVVTIRFPLTYNTCRIIDGQHRLLGFSVLSNEIQKNHYLPVIALQKYDRMKEIQTFVDINSKQQKIDRNLILLLKSTLDFEIGSKEYKEKIAVKAAEELSSFFKGRLYRGAADEVKGDKITLTTMVSGMMKNNQIYDTVEDTTKKLREYFNYVQKFIPEQSFQSGAYFGSNIGISVLFRLINLLQRNFDANRIQISKEEFFQDMNSILSKDLVRRLSLYLGDAGSKIASDIVITELRKKFPTKYGKMASNLTYLRKPKSKKI